MSTSTKCVVRHATPLRNVRSILRRGLLPSRALGRLRAVWLHTPGRTGWAIPHVAQRHHVAASAVAVLTLEVPRSWLRRNRRGCWTCASVIPPSLIVSVRHPRFSAA
jgi:hypothetical protein